MAGKLSYWGSKGWLPLRRKGSQGTTGLHVVEAELWELQQKRRNNGCDCDPDRGKSRSSSKGQGSKDTLGLGTIFLGFVKVRGILTF